MNVSFFDHQPGKGFIFGQPLNKWGKKIDKENKRQNLVMKTWLSLIHKESILHPKQCHLDQRRNISNNISEEIQLVHVKKKESSDFHSSENTALHHKARRQHLK